MKILGYFLISVPFIGMWIAMMIAKGPLNGSILTIVSLATAGLIILLVKKGVDLIYR